MDISPRYAMMCKAAGLVKEGYDGHDFVAEDGQWLPRQDQLQEMVAEDFHNEKTLSTATLFDFGDYAKRKWMEPHSMEELWLRFVMKVKHWMKWNDDLCEWVSIHRGND